MTDIIQRIVLASRPVGEPTLDNFRSEKLPIRHLGSDEMLLRTLWLSLDPYMRGRMSDAPSYAKPVGIGDAMESGTVSEVAASNFKIFLRRNVFGKFVRQIEVFTCGSYVSREPKHPPKICNKKSRNLHPNL
jgi:NADPH-dependent curcumin reductase CurA